MHHHAQPVSALLFWDWLFVCYPGCFQPHYPWIILPSVEVISVTLHTSHHCDLGDLIQVLTLRKLQVASWYLTLWCVVFCHLASSQAFRRRASVMCHYGNATCSAVSIRVSSPIDEGIVFLIKETGKFVKIHVIPERAVGIVYLRFTSLIMEECAFQLCVLTVRKAGENSWCSTSYKAEAEGWQVQDQTRQPNLQEPVSKQKIKRKQGIPISGRVPA